MTNACRPTAAPSDARTPANAAVVVGLRPARATSLFLGNNEPPLSDVVADPMIRRLMDRDGVELDALITLMDTVRARLI